MIHTESNFGRAFMWLSLLFGPLLLFFFISHDSSAQELSREIKKIVEGGYKYAGREFKVIQFFENVAVLFVPFKKVLQFYLFP